MKSSWTGEVTFVGFVRCAVSGFLTGSPTYVTAAASPASASGGGGASSKPNVGAIAGGVIGALLAVLLAGMPTHPNAFSLLHKGFCFIQ